MNEAIVVFVRGLIGFFTLLILTRLLGKQQDRASDLLEQLRNKGVFDLTQVEFAILETNGELSVQKKSQDQPVTPKDLNIPRKYAGVSTDLIYDGVIFDQNLKQIKLSRNWLMTELKSRGIKDVSEVFLASMNTQGELFIDMYKDRIANITDISDYRGPQ